MGFLRVHSQRAFALGPFWLYPSLFCPRLVRVILDRKDPPGRLADVQMKRRTLIVDVAKSDRKSLRAIIGLVIHRSSGRTVSLGSTGPSSAVITHETPAARKWANPT